MDERRLIIAQSGTFVALLAAGSWISIPFYPVPLTLQTLFLLLAGVVMKRRAIIPVIAYLLLGLLNLPVFHNGTAGIGVLLGPTGGYLIGFIPAVLVVGLAYENRAPAVQVAGIVLATGLIYFSGLSWLALSSGMSFSAALLVGMLPFLPGDALKALVAFSVGRRLS
ncbi:MAG: biotin transporter BioY [Methanoculleaceae archaeon]